MYRFMRRLHTKFADRRDIKTQGNRRLILAFSYLQTLLALNNDPQFLRAKPLLWSKMKFPPGLLETKAPLEFLIGFDYGNGEN